MTDADAHPHPTQIILRTPENLSLYAKGGLSYTVMRKRKIYASVFTRIQVELVVHPAYNWPTALLSRVQSPNSRVDPPDQR